MTEIVLSGETLALLPEKAVKWVSSHTLFISDIHLGKVMHFRKAGIAVPSDASLENYKLLGDLFASHKPERVVFLGDLFHSEHNNEWSVFCEFIQGFPDIQFDLVVGNHDILNRQSYIDASLHVHEQGLVLPPFYLSHHPEEKTGYYNLCGHIHPGIRLRGKARQSLRLSCFVVKEAQMVLPAFGTFTGLHMINPGKDDRIFAIANREVLKIA